MERQKTNIEIMNYFFLIKNLTYIIHVSLLIFSGIVNLPHTHTDNTYNTHTQTKMAAHVYNYFLPQVLTSKEVVLPNTSDILQQGKKVQKLKENKVEARREVDSIYIIFL